LFFIGEILKTKGNKGELIVRVSPDFNFNDEGKITLLHLESKKKSVDLSVERIVTAGSNLIIKFTDINTISDAYGYIGYLAYIDDDKALIFQKDSFENYKVYDLNGEYWGKVINDEKSEFTHTLEIEEDNDIIYIPYSDNIVIEKDEIKKILIIDPPMGLRDLNK